MQTTSEKQPSWLDRSPFANFQFGWEILIFALIVLLAVVTRFYLLEPRVMSHDENSHVYYSWLLYKGRGYSHDPVTHGPFQFHIVALSYFLFGDSDTSARIPAVLFSIASVWFIWYFRRYMGRVGALIAALLLVISPYMLYYGRYVRNEAFVVLWGLIMLWATLRYLETGQTRYWLWLIGSIALHYATKETAYMYVAELLVFLALFFIYQLLQKPWANPSARTGFGVSLLAAAGLGGVGVLARALLKAPAADPAATEAAAAASGGLAAVVLFVLAALALVVAIYYLMNGQLDPVESLQPVWRFMGALVGVALLVAVVVVYGMSLQPDSPLLTMLQPPDGVTPVAADQLMGLLAGFLALLIPIGAGVALFFCGRYLMQRVVQFWPPQQPGSRSLDLIVLIVSIILPTLAAFLINLIGNPTDYSLTGMIKSAVILIPLTALAVGIGLGWQRNQWLTNAALFYGIFVVLYTTVFTNGQGFFTGLIGGLGYWLEQQGVNRGSQPMYYYALVQVPFYEFLPALGSLAAAVYLLLRRIPLVALAQEDDPVNAALPTALPDREPVPAIPLMGFWSIASLLAFSYAGEKMPWLTVHIVLPLILLAGWFLGQVVEGVDWAKLRQQRGWLALLLLVVFVVSASAAIGGLIAAPPFQGQQLDQLNHTATFLTSLVVAVLSGVGLFRWLKEWPAAQIASLVLLAVFAFLGVITARSAFMASYENYDRSTEFLVYAHSAPGVKIALSQIEEISRRTTGVLDVKIAFDNETTYPYWWYLRNYPNQYYYGANPSRDLRDYPLILIGDANYGKIEPIVGKAYDKFEYIRIWWPMQDYFNLTPERVWHALTDPAMRAALFEIWWYRDYSKYSQLTSQNLTLENWSPAGKMRLYIRKDISSQLWDYGAAPITTEELFTNIGLDVSKEIQLVASSVVGATGVEPGRFNLPHGIAVAADNSIYVADSGNHRIQRLAPDGEVLAVWGDPSPVAGGDAPDGTFSEPWDVAVGPDGSVYVADTWNHRIQKFTADGQFLAKWGFGISQNLDDPYGLYGPRGIAVDDFGLVYVTDTGNKRILVYDEEGNFISQMGEGGFGPEQFSEPVGVAVNRSGLVFVADTWNQRVQSLQTDDLGNLFALSRWDVDGWYGKSITNYPYVTTTDDGHVLISDPETPRIIEYTTAGELVRFWGVPGADMGGLNLPTGLAATADGGLWVADTGNNRLLYFVLP
jgi:predicted membrane-bound mannosyltransferase/DNA-binding beta-propeller fold protein YncE